MDIFNSQKTGTATNLSTSDVLEPEDETRISNVAGGTFDDLDNFIWINESRSIVCECY
jgi:hypothetical protein